MTTQTLPHASSTTQPSPDAPRRLTPECLPSDPTYMTDLLTILAARIEDSLLQWGARPGVDYTFRDLVTWAMPAIHEGMRNGTVNWQEAEALAV